MDTIKMTTYYKLCHSTDSTRHFYIGSTNYFDVRQRQHQINYNKGIHQKRVHNYIRKNGGWDNWTFEVLEQVLGERPEDRCVKEGKFIRGLGSKLNTHKTRI